MWSNYHTHSHYCDGKGRMVDYLEAAKKHGVRQLGFSSHAPLSFPCQWCMTADAFPRYLNEIQEASIAYPQMQVYKGLEVDFIPGMIGPADFRHTLDYTIGSIHFVDGFQGKFWEIDNTSEIFNDGLRKIFEGDVRAAVSRYYGLTREMINNSPPDILGHMDKIKINALGPAFDETDRWYAEEVEKTLQAIRQTNIIIEVNTRGLYKKKSETTYPSPWILERILSMEIPVTISSDAHHPDDLTRGFLSTVILLNKLGFKTISVLDSGVWKKTRLTEYGSQR